MRVFLAILAVPAGGLTLVMFLSALTKDGSDLQLIGAGVFMTAFVVCLGLIGVMVRLEEIRDRRP
jgi:hypothetical protein